MSNTSSASGRSNCVSPGEDAVKHALHTPDGRAHEASTRLLYLEDPARREGRALVTAVRAAADGMLGISLNATTFYPQRGGQPSDSGHISGPGWRLDVVRAVIEGSDVIHIGRPSGEVPSVGDQVSVEIDVMLRDLHSRLHTAGELICALMPLVQQGSWPVAKAIHFPDHAAVEFERSLDKAALSSLARRLEARLRDAIRAGHPVSVSDAPNPAAAVELCGFLPEYLDPGESVRIVRVWGSSGRPCMGTHVRDIAEIGEILVRRVKASGARTTVSYTLPVREASRVDGPEADR